MLWGRPKSSFPNAKVRPPHFFPMSRMSDVTPEELWGFPINSDIDLPLPVCATVLRKKTSTLDILRSSKNHNIHVHLSHLAWNPQTHHTHTKLQETIVFRSMNCTFVMSCRIVWGPHQSWDWSPAASVCDSAPEKKSTLDILRASKHDKFQKSRHPSHLAWYPQAHHTRTQNFNRLSSFALWTVHSCSWDGSALRHAARPKPSGTNILWTSLKSSHIPAPATPGQQMFTERMQSLNSFLSGGVFFIWLVMRRKYAWSCFPNSSLDLTLANLMLKASGPSSNNSSHFLPIPFLTLRRMFSSRRGELGNISSWSFKSRSISCLTNAFPSLLLLKFWGRACGNAGWMTNKKEYDGVQDNSNSMQPNLGPLELFTSLEKLETCQNKGYEFHVFTCGEKWYPTTRCASKKKNSK